MNGHPTLASLYPFLHGGTRDTAGLAEALRISVLHKAQEGREVQQAFFAQQGDALVAMAGAVAQVYRHGGRLFTMGNGGSSCDAAHIAVEFLHPVTAGRPALAAHDLAADVAMLTAVGNDVGHEQVFARQLQALARRGDGLVGVSTSGNSANLLAAFRVAREIGVATFGLAGHEGGAMARAGLDHCLVVPSASIHRVQETHVAIYHILWDLVHTLLADSRGAAP
jgi:D-sedoheptulose 7-phosphate isomerase